MARGIGVPWNLDLAWQCMDMASGTILHLPRSGGLLDQDPFIIEQMRYAFKTIDVYSRKDKSMNDISFISWVNN